MGSAQTEVTENHTVFNYLKGNSKSLNSMSFYDCYLLTIKTT